VRAIGIGRHDRRQLVAERHLDAFGGRRRAVERVGPIEQPGAVLVTGRVAASRISRAPSGLDRNVLAVGRLELQIPLPGEEPIDPGDDLASCHPTASTTKRAIHRSVPGEARSSVSRATLHV
jgi:hypothetical protein